MIRSTTIALLAVLVVAGIAWATWAGMGVGLGIDETTGHAAGGAYVAHVLANGSGHVLGNGSGHELASY